MRRLKIPFWEYLSVAIVEIQHKLLMELRAVSVFELSKSFKNLKKVRYKWFLWHYFEETATDLGE